MQGERGNLGMSPEGTTVPKKAFCYNTEAPGDDEDYESIVALNVVLGFSPAVHGATPFSEAELHGSDPGKRGLCC